MDSRVFHDGAFQHNNMNNCHNNNTMSELTTTTTAAARTASDGSSSSLSNDFVERLSRALLPVSDTIDDADLDRRQPPPHLAHLPRASVLVLLFLQQQQQQQTKIYTFITKRSMQLRSHPGECCFPGGRQDVEEDQNDDVRTALREAYEEVGLHASDVTILGRMRSLESINHLCVTPIVGLLNTATTTATMNTDTAINNEYVYYYPWKLNRDEVEDAFVVPLSFFLQEPVLKFEVEWSGEIFIMRRYEYHDDHKQKVFAITGLTAHIAHEVAALAFNNQEGTRSHHHLSLPMTATTTTTTVCAKQKTPKSGWSSSSEIEVVVSGYLWKREMSSRGRTYWTRRFFVCTAADAAADADNTSSGGQRSTSDSSSSSSNNNNSADNMQASADSSSSNNSNNHSLTQVAADASTSASSTCVPAAVRVLHQYDNETQASRKSNSAYKKHRLLLEEEDCKVVIPTPVSSYPPHDHHSTSTNSYHHHHHQIVQNEKYEFSILTVGGRVVWHLAASTEQDRATWMRAIARKSQVIN